MLLLLLVACFAAEPEVPVAPGVLPAAEVAPVPDTVTVPPPTVGSLRDIAAESGLSWPPPSPRVVVRKADRRLLLYSGQTLLKVYQIGLGGAPAGDKVRQGDQRTPTGDFTVVTRNDRSQYHLFLGLSYPTAEDADRGLAEGLITEAQARSIREAEAAGRRPDWDTALGGAIGIHGKGSGSDWTLGCVALEDADVDELWAVLPHGSPVRIEE